jgi:hypothetical protein
VLWSNAPLESEKIKDKNTDTAIWEGKSKEDGFLLPGTLHPNCRGGWVRWGGKSADAMGAKIRGKIEAWDKAVKQARDEYRENRIDNQNKWTHDYYVDRINELYQSYLGR